MLACRAERQSSSGSSVCRWKAMITASCSIDSTVDLATFGPVARSAVEVRRFHLATVFWLMPWRLAKTLRLA